MITLWLLNPKKTELEPIYADMRRFYKVELWGERDKRVRVGVTLSTI